MLQKTLKLICSSYGFRQWEDWEKLYFRHTVEMKQPYV